MTKNKHSLKIKIMSAIKNIMISEKNSNTNFESSYYGEITTYDSSIDKNNYKSRILKKLNEH